MGMNIWEDGNEEYRLKEQKIEKFTIITVKSTILENNLKKNFGAAVKFTLPQYFFVEISWFSVHSIPKISLMAKFAL